MDRTTTSTSTWFDTQRIESTVTRQFACSQLLPDEVDQLDKPLAFGDGLTDCTYWEWIQDKAKRLFLILVDLDLADQIFGIVDDSWEDDDLPIALDQVERLSLTADEDPRTDRKFFHRQFHYLLRPLERGEHLDYQELEVVPLDVHERRPGLAQNIHDAERVELPNQPGLVFCRRRFPIGPEADCMSRERFLSEISLIQDLQNEHIVSYWASYTHQGYGYVLFTPACEYRLSAYLANTPPSIKILHKLVRRRKVLDWIHCLVDTLCFMHSRGMALGNIKPSTISFTHNNHIFYSPFNRLHPDTAASSQGSSFDKETYDYAAPEQRAKPTKHTPIPIRPKASGPSSSRGSTVPPSRSGSRSRSHTEHHKLPLTPPQQPPPPLLPLPLLPNTPPQQRPSSSSHHHSDHSSTPHLNPQQADIFSIGCIILELLSHGFLKRSASSFASHRGAKHKVAGRGGAVLDSSFHKNLGQVETWMGGLAKEADKKASKRLGGGGGGTKVGKEAGARLFGAVTPILHVVERMLSPHPPSRPSAPEVQRAIYQILTQVSGVTGTHCAERRHGAGVLEPRDSGSGSVSGGAMATIDETAMSPIAASPPGFGFGTYHHDFAYDDDASTGRSNSHKRDASDESVRSRSSSSSQSYGERRDAASGSRAMQNLRISKSWQPNLPVERDIASRHSR